MSEVYKVTAEETIEQNREVNIAILRAQTECDKYDYLTAIGCGAISGIIDIFLVGSPTDSKLLNWSDAQVDKIVMAFAEKMGWDNTKNNTAASAIGFLERLGKPADLVNYKEPGKYRINYDQTSASAFENAPKDLNMNTKNHHIMSLGHAPDIIGLFFSVLDQFTRKASFISNGKVIRVKTEYFELRGGNFIAKIYCGITNWFVHIMSDIAGSSGCVGRGTGLPIPFFELFQFFKFGKFSVEQDKQDIATIAIRAFQEGYDFRFGIAMSVPVLVTELLLRLIWSLRRHFQYNLPLKECIPKEKYDSLRIMLLFGHGTLCVFDGISAGVKSGGNMLIFICNLNIIAWFRFITLVLKEVFIRLGLPDSLQKTIDAYKQVNQALLEYLHELQKIDIDLYKKETATYVEMTKCLDNVKTERDLNTVLLDIYETAEIKKPWVGDFNLFMGDKSKTLKFE